MFDEYPETPGITTGVFHWPTLNLEWSFVHLNWSFDAYPWQKQEVFKGVNAAMSRFMIGQHFVRPDEGARHG